MPTTTLSPAGAAVRWMRQAGLSPRVLVILLCVVLLMAFFNEQSDGAFLSGRNLSILVRQTTVVAIAAMGVAMLMIMREIDLSIGSASYLCGVALAFASVRFDQQTAPMMLAALAVGILIGLWQAFWVVVMRVPAFIATLAGFLGFRAIGLIVTGASPIGIGTEFSVLSEAPLPAALSLPLLGVAAAFVIGVFVSQLRTQGFRWAFVTRGAAAVAILAFLVWLALGAGLPSAMIWLATVSVVLAVYMGRTRIGRNNYVVGANRAAARLAGINTRVYVFGAFTLMGVIYAICAILGSARLASVGPSSFMGLELDAIAGAVIGGVSLNGGKGSIVGALGGALLLTTIDNGLTFMDIDSNVQPAVKALILLIAVGIDMRFQRKTD